MGEIPFFQRDNGFAAVLSKWDKTLYAYNMGLIDVPQPWSVMKAVETARDQLFFPQQVGSKAMNNIAPDQYSTRMVEFLQRISASEYQIPSSNESESALHIHALCHKQKLRASIPTHKPLCEHIGLTKKF